MSVQAGMRCIGYGVTIAGLLSCGDGSALIAPDPARDGAHASESRELARSKILKRSARLKSDLVATTTVTPNGGMLSMPEAGLIVLFPSGAVTSNVEVTVTAHGGKEIVYSFEPHGVQFAQPIAIAQSVRSIKHARNRDGTLADMHGGYLLRGMSDIDAQGYASFAETFRVSHGPRGRETYVYFLTTHFSGYAMASGRVRVSVDVDLDG